jgi:hypothetical protein
MTDWYKMETCPKGDDDVLIWADNHRAQVCTWFPDEEDWFNGDVFFEEADIVPLAWAPITKPDLEKLR